MTLKDFLSSILRLPLHFPEEPDSAYLCYMAKKYAKEMTAIYVSTAFQPTFEKEDAIRFCKEYAIPLTILERDVLSQEAVVQNPANRCYYCKKVIFSEIQKKALELGFTCLADGTNASDDADDRPGMKALQEMKVLSPLRICGITKPALRDVSEQLGLFYCTETGICLSGYPHSDRNADHSRAVGEGGTGRKCFDGYGIF